MCIDKLAERKHIFAVCNFIRGNKHCHWCPALLPLLYISSINRAIGLHCGCEMNVWPWDKNTYFPQILILSIRLIFFSAVNFPSCSIFFSILQHITFYFNAFLFLHLLKKSFHFYRPHLLQCSFQLQLTHTEPKKSLPAVPETACLHWTSGCHAALCFLLTCFLRGFLPPCLLVFLMAHSIWSRKKKNFITFQGLVTLHFCWLKKYTRKARHPFYAFLSLWFGHEAFLSYLSACLLCAVCLFLEGVHLESLDFSFLSSV